MNHLWEQVTDL